MPFNFREVGAAIVGAIEFVQVSRFDNSSHEDDAGIVVLSVIKNGLRPRGNRIELGRAARQQSIELGHPFAR